MPNPKKVHTKNGRYYYVHANKWHQLTRVEDGTPALYRALQKFTVERPATYGQVMIKYIGEALPELKPASQPEYERIISTRLQHHFGSMILNTLKPSHVAQYLELRKREGAPVGGNRERAVLGSVCSWAMRFGWLEFNPCHGVRRNRETPSRVYVTDVAFREAFDRASPALQDLTAVALLTGLRQTDLRLMKLEAVTKDGLSLRQSKDGKLRLIEWSEALRFFVNRAWDRSQNPPQRKARFKGHEPAPRLPSDFLFVSEQYRPWSVDGLQSAMRRWKPGFQFRAIRPKAASDAEHNVLGHDAQMLARYVRAQRLKPVR
jgi:integrase